MKSQRRRLRKSRPLPEHANTPFLWISRLPPQRKRQPDLPTPAPEAAALTASRQFKETPAYNAAIRNFCIAKRLGDSYQLMDEMVNKGLNPSLVTYHLFFRCFYWSNDLQSSWSLYRRMMDTGCLPNTQSCMFLVRLFRRHEKVSMTLHLWDDMVEKGFASYTLVSDALFYLLYDMGKLDEVEKCFHQMIGKGQKPSNVSFRRIKVLMELANRYDNLRNLA